MANKSVNFDAARFARNLTKSFSTATRQAVSYYMPFTSDTIMDIGDNVFSAREFIVENRPDRKSRNSSNILKSLSNAAFEASKSAVRDLSHGDLSFKTARAQIDDYLNRNVKSEFDFGFDDDFDAEYDENDENSGFPSEKSFSVEDFAEGIYASTSATVNAIEASYKNVALANAKSSNILGDRLIANNMASMAQTMQMLETVNKNISGINVNLSYLVEYNNTTMNDFIKNTNTHFAKVEKFMDMITKKYEVENEESRRRRRNNDDDDEKYNTNVFKGLKINTKNLIGKTLEGLDNEITGGTGSLIGWSLLGMKAMFGGKLPKALEDYSYLIPDAVGGDFNPALMLLSTLVPELGKMKKLDNLFKGATAKLKKKVTTDKMFGGWIDESSFIGRLMQYVFGDENTIASLKKQENKATSWSTQDSSILQTLPTLVNNTNVHLFEISNNVSSISNALDINVRTNMGIQQDLQNLHIDLMKYIANDNGTGELSNRIDALTRNMSRVTSGHHRQYGKYKSYKRDRDDDILRNKYMRSDLLYDINGTHRSEDIVNRGRSQMLNAANSGRAEIAAAVRQIITANDSIENLDATYGTALADLQEELNELQHEMHNDSLMDDFNESEYLNGITDAIERLFSTSQATDSRGRRMKLTNEAKLNLERVIAEAQETRRTSISDRAKDLTSDTTFMRAAVTKNPKFNMYSVYDTDYMIDSYLREDGRAFNNIEQLSSVNTVNGLLDMIAQDRFLRDQYDNRISVDAARNSNDPYIRQAYKNYQKAVQDMMKQRLKSATSGRFEQFVSGNAVNKVTGAGIDTLAKYGSRIINGDRNFTIGDIFSDFKSAYTSRQGQAKLDEEGNPITTYIYGKKDNFGKRQKIDGNYQRSAFEEDPVFTLLKAYHAANGNTYNPNTHTFYNSNGEKVKEQYSPGSTTERTYDSVYRYSQEHGIPSHATGATRIDKDKLVRVHEGEMILDSAFSDTVRKDFADMISAKAQGKTWTDDQQKHLLAAIEASDERFKGKSKEVLNAIKTEIQNHDLNGNVRLSDQSVCFIEIDQDDSPSTVMMKTLSEIATNLRTMLGASIGKATEEEKGAASTELKGNLGKLFGSFDKENKTFNGGLLSKAANAASDDVKYWLFNHIGGFSYKGRARDENGKVIEGEDVDYKNGADNPKTISKVIDGIINKKADEIAKELGLSDQEKDMYLGSVKDILGGVKGAGKGWVAGIAIKSILGLSLGPAFGLIGGFAMANKTTRELIIGAETKDAEGNTYRYGGIFSGLVNKFTELGRDIKTSFLAVVKEVGTNLKDATKTFITELMDKDKPSIVGNIIRGVKDMTFTLTGKITDVIVDAANIGARLLFNTAKLPFNIAANILGGKSYRKGRKEAKIAAKDAKARADLKEFAMYQWMTGGAINEKLAGIAYWDAYNVGKTRKKIKKVGTAISEGYTNANDKFVGFQGKAKDKLTELLTGIKTDFGTMIREHGIGIKALMNMIPASIAAFSMGNIPAALAIAGFNLGNVAMENLTGVGLTGIIMKGAQLLGKRAGRGIKRAAEGAGNLMHLLKNRLGIKDTKFHLKMANSSLLMDDANMIADLGFKDDQDAYYAWRKSGGSEEGLSEDQLNKFREIGAALDSGLSTEDRTALSKAQAQERRLKELSGAKNLTSDEKAELKELKAGRRDRRRQIFDLNNKSKMFKADHGLGKIGGYDRAGQIAENYDKVKEATAFKNDLFGEFKREMFITPDGNPLSDEEFALRRSEYNKQRDILRKQITSKFKTKDDFENNIDEIKQMISANKYVGKSRAAMEGKSTEDIRKFVLGNSYTDEAVRTAEGDENKFKDAIINPKTGILGGVNQTVDNLKNIASLIGKIIDNKINGKPTTPDETSTALVPVENTVAEEYVEHTRNNTPIALMGPVARPTQLLLPGPVQSAAEAAQTEAAATTESIAESTANSRVGMARVGLKAGLSETMASVKSSLGELVGVFKGDRHGTGDEKLSFIEKMRQGFDGVGTKISTAVFGSGLIPIDPKTGKPDIAKIGARIIALIGGAIVLGPTLIKLAEKLKPLIAPIFEGIIKGVGAAIDGIGGLIKGALGLDADATFFDVWSAIWEKNGAAWFDFLHKDIHDLRDSMIDAMTQREEEHDENYSKFTSDEFKAAYNNSLKEKGLDKGPLNIIDDVEGAKWYKRYGVNSSESFEDLEASYTEMRDKALSSGSESDIEAFKKKFGANPDFAEDFSGLLLRRAEARRQNYVDLCARYYLAVKPYTENSVRKELEKYTYDAKVDKWHDYWEKLVSHLTNAEFQFARSAYDSNNERKSLQLFIKVIKDTTNNRIPTDLHVNANNNYESGDVEKFLSDSYDVAVEAIQHRITYLTSDFNKPGNYTNVETDQTKLYSTLVPEMGTAFEPNLYDRENGRKITDPASYQLFSNNENPDDIYYGYTQNDPRWSNMGYGRFKSGSNSTMGMGGCGPTAMANVYSNLTGRKMNPAQMAKFSQANGYNAQGGTSSGLFTTGAKRLGLSSKAIGKNGAAIGRSVRHGNNVVIAGKNGPYTKSGHIMSVRGVDGYGNAIVDDPLKRGARHIPMNKLTKGMTHAWSIGYGSATASDGSPYTYYSDMYNPNDVSFNVMGGAFGYHGSNVGGPSSMNGACIYNSFTNSYINASLLPDVPFSDFVKSAGYTPSTLKTSGMVTSYNGSSGVTNYDTLKRELMAAYGLSDINIINHMDPLGTSSEKDTQKAAQVADEIIANLMHGNPILFSVNNGDSTGDLGLISASYNHGKYDTPYSRYYQHGVMLVGLKKGPSGSYTDGSVVIDNPARTGINQIQEMDISKFKSAITQTGYAPYIHRLVYFERDPKAMQQVKSTYEAMYQGALHDSNGNAYTAFVNKYGEDAFKNGYSKYEDYIAHIGATSGAIGGSTGTVGTVASGGVSGGVSSGYYTSDGDGGDLRTHKTTHNFGDYLAEIMSRLTQFGSNMFGAFLNGNLNGIFSSGNSSSGSSGYYSGGYSSGGSGGGGGNPITIAKVVIDAAYVKSMIDNAMTMDFDVINPEISKCVGDKYIISESNYNSLVKNPSYEKMLKAIATTEKYKDLVQRTVSSIFTWVLALQVIDLIDKVTTAHDVLYNRIGATAQQIFNKLKDMKLVGIPTNNYNLIPEWAKTGLATIDPGQSGLTTANLTEMMDYIAPIIMKNETGITMPSANDIEGIEKAYFTAKTLSGLGEGYTTIGRSQFHGGTTKDVFNRVAAANSPISAKAKEAAAYIANNLAFTSRDAEINKLIKDNPDMKPALMSVQDAKSLELIWNDYFTRILPTYVSKGMRDPRSIMLEAEFGGVSQNIFKSLNNVTNPGAADELYQVREAMKNYYKNNGWNAAAFNGWDNRIDATYDLLTTGYSNYKKLSHPLPANLKSLVPTGSIGLGFSDAGYNMRDNNYRYTDDVYMGDADHPMNVTMDNTPVTTRLDKLIYLLDSAVNYEEPPKAGPSNAKSLGSGDGEKKPQKKVKSNAKGVTNVGQHDKLATIHSRIAKRPRVSMNYNHM